jgi:hypothetical protein
MRPDYHGEKTLSQVRIMVRVHEVSIVTESLKQAQSLIRLRALCLGKCAENNEPGLSWRRTRNSTKVRIQPALYGYLSATVAPVLAVERLCPIELEPDFWAYLVTASAQHVLLRQSCPVEL